MSARLPPTRPMDPVLRARLHLGANRTWPLMLLRGGLHTVDALSRAVLGKPFFGLRECEDLLRRTEGKLGTDLLAEVLAMRGGTEIVAHGLDHVPAQGPVVIAATHPTGIFDFIAHAGALLPLRPDLRVVANQEVERFLGPEAIVPVRIDRQNRALSGRATYEAMQRHLDTGGALLIFGSGRVPNCRDGQLAEPPWRDGASRVSAQCAAPVVPAALDARNSRYYYRLRALAQMLSGGSDDFGAMIGSLRYAAEMLDKLGGRYHVHYGAPQPPGTAPERLKQLAETLVPGLYRAG